MIRLSAFTPRMWLILAHDLLVTATAVVASFFIRFEETGLIERWRFLAIVLPAFVVYSGFVYVLVAPNVYGTFFFGKITIILYWLLQIAFLSGPRIGYRYFRYTRTLRHAKAGDPTPILVVGHTADADVLLCAIESGAVKEDPRGGYPVAVLGGSAPSYTRRFRARRTRRH